MSSSGNLQKWLFCLVSNLHRWLQVQKPGWLPRAIYFKISLLLSHDDGLYLPFLVPGSCVVLASSSIGYKNVFLPIKLVEDHVVFHPRGPFNEIFWYYMWMTLFLQMMVIRDTCISLWAFSLLMVYVVFPIKRPGYFLGIKVA